MDVTTEWNVTWLEVDRKGLGKVLEKRGKAFAIFELVQNAWDADGVSEVHIKLDPVEGRAICRLSVEDNAPEGFKDLSHAFVLFAESEKKDKPEKRGRFNLGEKLVICLCDEVAISSTTGTVEFHADGTRERSRAKRKIGSEFSALIRMNRSEFAEVQRAVNQLIVPTGIKTTFNGVEIKPRKPIATFEATLPTVRADEEGNLTPTERKTTVAVYLPVHAGERGGLYEMGIPLGETRASEKDDDKFDVDIGQKVPVNLDRMSVRPSYLKLVRALVVNEVHENLTEDDAKSVWVTQAMGSDAIQSEAVRSVITTRFGEDVVTYDPSDREANHNAAARDFQVIHGGVFPKEAWENVRKAEAIRPAGQVFPTHGGSAPSTSVDEEDLTEGHRRVRRLAQVLAQELCGIKIAVRFFRGPKVTHVANYGDRTMGFNLSHLSPAFFDIYGNLPGVIDLLIHELGHEYESSHLSERYHKAITKMAGKVAVLALTQPAIFTSK